MDAILSWAGFLVLAAIVGVAPWLFGAWEVWWFWGFAALVFAASCIFALRLIAWAFFTRRKASTGEDSAQNDERESGVGRMAWLLLLSFAPFLILAFFRALRVEVSADGQRSFLLFLTPLLIGVNIAFGFNAKQVKAFYAFLMINLALLGAYGIANHFFTGSRLVLWADAYPQYVDENRASGSYFCPDHFAGVMEVAFALALGLLMARETGARRRLLGAGVALVALTGVVLSKSRGGGLAIVAIIAAALVWGFSQWPKAVRWYLRLALAATLALALLGFCVLAKEYVSRFVSAAGREFAAAKTPAARKAIIKDAILTSSRGRMYAGALRAWDTDRLHGIGPGMHQNLWPHFAPSRDGNSDLGVWPSLPNCDFHSYETHSDWLQLLEEYGFAGFALFMLAFAMTLGVLLNEIEREAAKRKANKWRDMGSAGDYPLALGALLALVALAFHSLGDFNLQMPATAWLLAAALALPISGALRSGKPQA